MTFRWIDRNVEDLSRDMRDQICLNVFQKLAFLGMLERTSTSPSVLIKSGRSMKPMDVNCHPKLGSR